MARLIDADKLSDFIYTNSVYGSGYHHYKDIVYAIEKQPIIDPVKHSRWVFDPNAIDWNIGGWQCEECRFTNLELGNSEQLYLPINLHAGARYCPCCGAKMDKEG